jgi:hypothetical protein
MIYMRTLITLIACIFSITGFAQTKLISFRSHSGSNTHFRTAVEKDLFDIGGSNFGIVELEKIDSVIMESKNRIIVSRRFYGSGKGAQRDTLTSANASEIFAATSKESLKAALHKKYRKANLDNTRFIGFNNKLKQNNAPKK